MISRPLSYKENILNAELLSLPASFSNRFCHAAECHLRRVLFQSLAGQRDEWIPFFFPDGPPRDRSEKWSLRTAQGAVDGAEYTAAARGTACGHIFRNGESTYHCKTCASDDTCVLCAKCFESSDHEGHMVLISVSPGNSGCCDCGDSEAWKREIKCSIHSAEYVAVEGEGGSWAKDKKRATNPSAGLKLPAELVEAIRMTIARCCDHLCDVLSCSPEQLRLPKTEASILQDERTSRLSSLYGEERHEARPEFALVLWNDEKHTVDDVQNQVARACRQTKTFGLQKAMEVNDVGRSVIQYSRDINELLRMSEIIEQLKLTVTIRSARDTFREQMCATIIDWFADIAGCSVGDDGQILRNVICEAFLKTWRTGSPAANKNIGQAGIDDHEIEDSERYRRRYEAFWTPLRRAANVVRVQLRDDGAVVEANNDNENDEYDEDEDWDMDAGEDVVDSEIDELDILPSATVPGQAVEMDLDLMGEPDDLEDGVGTMVGGFTIPPPPPGPQRRRILTPQDSDDGDTDQNQMPPVPPSTIQFDTVPRTPQVRVITKKAPRPSRHWLEKPEAFRSYKPTEPCEDLWQRVRLDYLILYDLRLWKILRVQLRHLYITTVVTVPRFKRILGLRFAGLYTPLAQLYLIADREPDHSIINLSVQMLTTPTITQEVVERGNFLTHLMAILYTFITTRQVGFPEEVNPRATLDFDAGAVTNRRMFHFFLDLRWLFQSELIQQKIRTEPRYLLQFLDLVKLHQGVCPNVRATGEHVEYESDAWISASMIVKEINKLCKQVAMSYSPLEKYGRDRSDLLRALRTVAQVTMINAFGYERKRFVAAEVKDDLAWHVIGPFEAGGKMFSVPKMVVQAEPVSFHHPLHYLLSWLLEAAKGTSREEIRALLTFSPDDLKDPWTHTRSLPPPSSLSSDELLCGIFDHPLRTCVWLAQMKAGMWVRNGITLRHQAHTYRSVSHRDVAYQRDIMIIQAGLVLCGGEDELPGERYLAQIINRFELDNWFKGIYDTIPGFEEPQQLDVIEDFFHLLIIALSDRSALIPSLDEQTQHDKMLQQAIAQAICFKPVSFSDLAGRVTEKVGESDDFNRVLEGMTIYRKPEGLHDTGTFELKPEYIELVDPYHAHYSRNNREEAEAVYKKHMARKTGKKVEDIVYEPRLPQIESGLFSRLSAFTETPLFAQVVGAALHFAAKLKYTSSKIQVTRVETFLHLVLHLVLLATLEDRKVEDTPGGFVTVAESTQCDFKADVGAVYSTQATVIQLLMALSGMDEYASCHASIRLILRKMQMRQPARLQGLLGSFNALLDRSNAGSPSSLSVEEKERKKREALARQARVMAQMKQQQNSFLENQGLSAADSPSFDEFEEAMSYTEEPESLEERKTWSFPAGTCILCQEETDGERLYGTFAFLGESNILRHTPVGDDPAVNKDYIQEVLDTPESLDRDMDHIRPFGVAGNNIKKTQKVGPDGSVHTTERHGLSKGFGHQQEVHGRVATSCGHIMHYGCFELYLTATNRRHAQQIARDHPERIKYEEFICPLCKALGNTFLPIIWKAKECAQEHELHAALPFEYWLLEANRIYGSEPGEHQTLQHLQQMQDLYSNRSYKYVESMFAPQLVQNMQDLSLEASPSNQAQDQAQDPQQSRYPLRRGYSLSRLFGIGQAGRMTTPAFTPTSEQTPSFEQTKMGDLFKAYQRMEKSMRVNRRLDSIDYSRYDAVNTLSRALGLSVTAFEIAHRGAGTDPLATSLIADIPDQVLTHLRITSETIESYLAVHILGSGSNIVAREVINTRNALAAQLFGNGMEVGDSDFFEYSQENKNLLREDTFLFFADWLSFMSPSLADAQGVLQLCYWAELVKTMYVYLLNRGSFQHPDLARTTDIETVSLNRALSDLGAPVHNRHTDQENLPVPELMTLRVMLSKYALPFLRKCAVLLFVRYGLDFDCPHDVNPESSELDRLTALLHIASIEDLCKIYSSETPTADTLRKITHIWTTQAEMPGRPLVLPHPAIFELVGLPHNYDVLTEEAIRRRCPTTGKEISDPVLCLHCGDIFCSQATCCMVNRNQGGCYQHMVRHGAQTGLFLNIRKCMVLLAHGPGNGSWQQAPYLDRHGEPDPTLRRHHQLFLNQRRYDKLLREVWLNHTIPTVISRKLEADNNPGGWETL